MTDAIWSDVMHRYLDDGTPETEDAHCWACGHPEHDDEVCAELVRAGEGERICGCLE